MIQGLAGWALYGGISVSVATGVGVATGLIPVEKLTNFLSGPQVVSPAQSSVEQPPKPAAKSSPTIEVPAKIAPKKIEIPVAQRPPVFDILRVEKDGSVLIAGNAEANSVVELINPDGSVLGKTKAGPRGDFVIILDNPLKPGNHELYLRSVLPQKTPIISAEAGIVHVPGADGGEVLAMVSKEGEASRILIKPKAEAPKVVVKKPAVTPAPAAAKPEKPTKVAKLEPVIAKKEVVEQPAPIISKPASDAPKEKPAAPVAKVTPKVEKAPEPAAPVVVKPIEKPVVKLPAPVFSPKVVVEAVEVEGGKIFIAGAVKRGLSVRVYIDNVPLGTVRGTADDRFLLQKTYSLSAGHHTVRADVVNRTSGKVLARAEVPLVHEPAPVVVVKVQPKPVAPKVIPAAPKPVAKAAPVVPKVEKVVQEPEVPQIVAKPVQPAAPKVVTAPVQEKPKADPEYKVASIGTPVAVIHTGSTIIIKPGDNLWRISRKTYGRGIRYTTIYNANRDQIRDPSRIYIGQIFKLPAKSDDTGN